MLKRLLLTVAATLVILSMLSCSSTPKYSHCELVIPLSNDFKEVSNEDYDATYSNGKFLVAVLRISFVAASNSGIPQTMTPYEFGNFWLDKCNRTADVISDGVAYCEYHDSSYGVEYFYLEAFYRSQYAYFVVLFAADARFEEDARTKFLGYAEDLYFTD